jgi:hypothetical protein
MTNSYLETIKDISIVTINSYLRIPADSYYIPIRRKRQTELHKNIILSEYCRLFCLKAA